VSNLCSEDLTWSELAFRILENNPAIKIQQIKPSIAKETLQIESSAFDPSLQGSFKLGETQAKGDLEINSTPPNRSGFDNKDESIQSELKLQKKLRFGTQLELKGQISKQDQAINSPISVFNDEDNTHSLSLGLQQPLLDGRGREIQERRLRQADLTLDISIHELAAYCETLIFNSLYRALDLYLNTKKIDVLNETLKLEKIEYRKLLERIDIGTLAATQKIAGEASLAQHQQDLIVLLSLKEQARLDLLQASQNNLNEHWNDEFNFPSYDVPNWAQIHSLSLHIDHALKHRYDLRQAYAELSQANLDVRYYKNGLLPKLDFFAQIGYQDFERKDAFNSINTDGDGLQYQLGLQFEMPLSQKKEKAELHQAQFQKDHAKLSIENLERILETEVRKTYLELNTYNHRLNTSKKIKAARAQLLTIEQERFDQGLSTSLEIDRVRTDYLKSQYLEIETEIDEFRTRLLLFYRDGSLLSRLNLKI